MMLKWFWYYPFMRGETEGSHSHEDLYRGIIEHGHRNVHFVNSLQEGLDWLKEHCQKHDVVLSLGAGNVNWLVYALRDICLQRQLKK